MSRSQIYVCYPQTRKTPTYARHDPPTRESVSPGGETFVPEVEVVAGLTINATVSFDAAGGLACVELWPDVEPVSGTRRTNQESFLRCANALLRRFGLDAITEIP